MKARGARRSEVAGDKKTEKTCAHTQSEEEDDSGGIKNRRK